MLSGEGNAGEPVKKATLHVPHTFFVLTFLCRCFAQLPGETFKNFLQCSYTFYGGNVLRVLVHFFFNATHFHLAMVAASISRFVTAVTKVSCCSSNNSNSRTLSLFFSLSFAGLPPTFSFPLSFSCSIFQIFGHDN